MKKLNLVALPIKLYEETACGISERSHASFMARTQKKSINVVPYVLHSTCNVSKAASKQNYNYALVIHFPRIRFARMIKWPYNI